MKHVLSLLNDEEYAFYAEPGYVEGLKNAGFDQSKITCVNVFDAGAADKTEAALASAKAAGEKLVLHCSGGEGRTGVVLAQVIFYCMTPSHSNLHSMFLVPCFTSSCAPVLRSWIMRPALSYMHVDDVGYI